MRPPERLTHRVSFGAGIIVVTATMVFALSSTSERVMPLATLAATVVGGSAAPLAAAEDKGTAIRPFRVNVPRADRGGHFAAWEEPALFASELRAAFKSLR